MLSVGPIEPVDLFFFLNPHMYGFGFDEIKSGEKKLKKVMCCCLSLLNVYEMFNLIRSLQTEKNPSSHDIDNNN